MLSKLYDFGVIREELAFTEAIDIIKDNLNWCFKFRGKISSWLSKELTYNTYNSHDGMCIFNKYNYYLNLINYKLYMNNYYIFIIYLEF